MIFFFFFFSWSSPEFGGKIPIFRTKIEPVCSADLIFETHTVFFLRTSSKLLEGTLIIAKVKNQSKSTKIVKKKLSKIRPIARKFCQGNPVGDRNSFFPVGKEKNEFNQN